VYTRRCAIQIDDLYLFYLLMHLKNYRFDSSIYVLCLLSEFMHGIGADRYVYFYLAVEVYFLATELHIHI